MPPLLQERARYASQHCVGAVFKQCKTAAPRSDAALLEITHAKPLRFEVHNNGRVDAVVTVRVGVFQPAAGEHCGGR